MLSGLDHHQADALGDGPGDHARAGAAYLTGVHCKKTGGTDIRCGISVDQIAAQKLASQTRFPSLELGCDDTRTVGACDSGYSCAYQNTLSWRTETSPLPPETNPRAVFERLFGAGDPNLPADVRARRAAARSSILDLIREDTQRMQGELGRADRRKIDEYLYAVREVEKRIESTESQHHEYAGMIEKPAGVPVLFKDYLKVMFDLQILALQGDLTRVITMMYGREGSQRTYGEIGIPEPHHPLTHHRGNPEWIEKFTRINVYHAENFAYFLGRLKSTPDGEGSLLDHSVAGLRQRTLRPQRPQQGEPPHRAGGPCQRAIAARPPHRLSRGHAHGKPVHDLAILHGRAPRIDRRQHRQTRAPCGSIIQEP